MNKKIVLVAVIISLAALAATPLLQSTGLATAPLSEIHETNIVFLRNIDVISGSLIKLDLTKHLES